ncbi:mannose-1-phosphate guanylyltransferase [Nocardioides acrostichi]|uniref:NTP transferase domain-containing protein n=1 Tax=Nocardioides acrostichi TaxID=2784339 RepID=A0A930V177_9ACTN|nr:sugar phosphate nucleotidyltransferase [Nocardioides acrostichi]MBF4161850.1 NTP transferase domain-containing protein [Nocardioides acrostichi]
MTGPVDTALHEAIEDFWAVVPAGGAGTRLWPLSRASEPKFLRDLRGSGRTLLQETYDRLAPLAQERFLVVTGAAHSAAVSRQLDAVPTSSILAEPSPRDSMAAIGLAAALLERESPEAVMGSFAADHVIADRVGQPGFADAVRLAVDVARDGWVVTIGIEPTHPSSAFGYIASADPLTEHAGASKVAAFVEKPSVETATAYLAAGGYRWNAGMFVVRPGVLLDLLADYHPELAAQLRGIAADPDTLDDVWPGLEKIAVDHAVAEPAAAAGRVATVPAQFAWDDVGDFDSLAGLLARDGGPEPTPAAAGPTVLGDPDRVYAVDSTGLIVPGERAVAVVGLDDVVVVDTPDAVLVTSRSRAQEVKQVVAALKDAGRTDLL